MIQSIKENIFKLRQEVEKACIAGGRKTNEVRIVAVSKTKPVSMIKEAYEAGIKDIGENYIQEVETKFNILKNLDIKWHFIGNVQSNKVKHLINFCSLLHSLDRESLVTALQKKLESEDKILEALIQINTSGETTKSGIDPSEIFKFSKFISKHERIKIKGLMTIAENSEDEKIIRENYKQLKKIFEELKVIDHTNFDLKELSMGMSGDYKIAIEEGATIIRIGSQIFGARGYKK